MPVVICPRCDRRQSVPKDLAGLTALCASCGEEMEIPRSVPRPPKPPSAPTLVIEGPELTGGDIRKTVLLLGGLILGVAVVLGLLLWAVTPSKKEAATPPTTATGPAVPVPGFERPRPAEPSGRDLGATVAGLFALGYAVLVVGTLLVILYAVGVFVAGVALARDAASRGLPPLPWAAAYFVFHVVGPPLGFSVASPLLAVLPPAGLAAGLALGLLASWYGGLMYLAVRRPGRKAACPRCRNPRLAYLVTCPHCGRADEV